jgi:hypothetical protein
MVAMKAQELSLRAIAAEMRAKGFQISHEGVQAKGQWHRQPSARH